MLLILIQFSRPFLDPLRDPLLSGRLPALRVRVKVTFDGILQAPVRVLAEVTDLVGIQLRKQGGRELYGKARMSLVEEPGAIDQAFRAGGIPAFLDDVPGQVQVGNDKGQFLLPVLAQRGLQ
jgi:hypothetical protein